MTEILLRLEATRVERCECGRIVHYALPVVVALEPLTCEVRVCGVAFASFDRIAETRRACVLACALYDLLRGAAPGVTTYQG